MRADLYIAGASQGLGKGLLKWLPNGVQLARKNLGVNDLRNKVVIFCGVNRDQCSADFLDYNIRYLIDIAEKQPKCIIFMSTVDIGLAVPNSYVKSKIAGEKVLAASGVPYLTFRLPMLLGPSARQNHLYKMFNDRTVNLSGDSDFCYLKMTTVNKILAYCLKHSIYGEVDLYLPNDSLRLSDVDAVYNLRCQFGSDKIHMPDRAPKTPDAIKKILKPSSWELFTYLKENNFNTLSFFDHAIFNDKPDRLKETP